MKLIVILGTDDRGEDILLDDIFYNPVTAWGKIKTFSPLGELFFQTALFYGGGGWKRTEKKPSAAPTYLH